MSCESQGLIFGLRLDRTRTIQVAHFHIDKMIKSYNVVFTNIFTVHLPFTPNTNMCLVFTIEGENNEKQNYKIFN